jgi:dipeptidyl aminopeptidase/acylaminoacyl peptidase
MKKIFLLFWVCLHALGQSDRIKVTDIANIKNVTDLILSKDGKRAVYTLNAIESGEKAFEYEYSNQLFLVNLQEPEKHVQLTFVKAGGSQADFSPDGKQIAFVRTINEKPQIFILSLDGGEPWQLTKSSYGATSPKYSADGSKIFFTSVLSFNELRKDSLVNQGNNWPLWSVEKPGLPNGPTFDKNVKANPDGNLAEIRSYLEKNVEDKKAKVINRLNFQGEATVEPEMKFSHIFMIDAKFGAVERPVTHGFVNYGNLQILSNQLILTRSEPSTHPDREQDNQIVSLDLLSENVKILHTQKGKNFSNLSISPDSRYLAGVVNTSNLLSYGQLVVLNVDGSNFRVADLDRGPTKIKWQNDSKNIFLAAPSSGAFPIFKTDVGTLKSTQISDQNTGVSNFVILPDSKILFSFTSISNPCELALASPDFNFKIISNLNTGWLKNKKLSLPTKGVYTNNLGQKVDYWVMKPTNFESGKKYPLLLQLHGGPTAMWGPSELSMWHEFQYLAAQGYGIVYLNQRGSGGYGKDFQFSNYRDWGTGPASDALGVCDIAQKESWVDTSRLVTTGGSYAGYLVAWIIAHDHRFKAAFAQRGVYDLTTFMGEGNAWRLVPNYFGLPWQNESITKIDQNSPYTWVQNIKTPLLIKHGENDLRTGVIQSEMLYKSLKILGKEVEYVRMPGGTHELSRSGNVRQRIDRLLRIHEFFTRYVSTK